MSDIVDVSNKNAEFWNELCGSHLASVLGIKDASPESLKKFDDWYFNFYPYLNKHILFSDLAGSDVLEIGLGYGTVSQKLAESGARYKGLDIAAGPVNMVNHRLSQNSLPGTAVQGSILEPPFERESFDTIIAIGCLHHTGDLKKAISQCYDLLRPGGRLTFMVYYAYSYRRFRQAPTATFKTMFKEFFGSRGVVGPSAAKERAAYDAGSDGQGAPHTDWISIRSLASYCSQFNGFHGVTENIDQEFPFSKTPREKLLNTPWPALVGLDLYATAIK